MLLRAAIHHDLTPSHIKKDEYAVQALVDLLENNWTNPFAEGQTGQLNIATGAASADVARDLLLAQKKGEEARQKFQESRLERGQNFFERLPRLNLKTFDGAKRCKTKVNGKEVILKSDNRLFAHMILVASSRKLSMKEVLKHPLGPMPWSLANTDGAPRKINKAALARKSEAKASPADEMEYPSACIIDGMSVVQKMKGDKFTLKSWRNRFLFLSSGLVLIVNALMWFLVCIHSYLSKEQRGPCEVQKLGYVLLTLFLVTRSCNGDVSCPAMLVRQN